MKMCPMSWTFWDVMANVVYVTENTMKQGNMFYVMKNAMEICYAIKIRSYKQ